jgi:hypothetical protein
MADDQPLVFTPTRSFAYRLVRYTVLPEVDKEVAARGEEPFLLREIAWPIIDRLVPPEQQAVRVPRARVVGDDSMSSILRFYVGFLAKELDRYEWMGKGYYRAHTEADISETELIDEAIDSGSEETDSFEGWIYAFSFPAIVKTSGPFPIKIGKTVGDVATRVSDQAKGSASFEQPVVLGKWQVKRVGPTELALHNVLKARSKWRENAPGIEWFDTTLTEVESIIKFVKEQ